MTSETATLNRQTRELASHREQTCNSHPASPPQYRLTHPGVFVITCEPEFWGVYSFTSQRQERVSMCTKKGIHVRSSTFFPFTGGKGLPTRSAGQSMDQLVEQSFYRQQFLVRI